MGQTLVLNSDFTPLSYIPLSSISWKDSIKQYWLDTVTVVEWYDDWEVHSPSMTLRVPAVVASKKFTKKKAGVRFSRSNLLLRDDFCCQYCSDELTLNDMTIDHVIPRARGGITKWDNVVASCYSCNATKGHRTSMKPAIPPVKPDHYDLLANARKMRIEVPDQSWIPYIGWDEKMITIRPPKKSLLSLSALSD
jgi:5-methylcytosine-specific restriction endonuclease McrA